MAFSLLVKISGLLACVNKMLRAFINETKCKQLNKCGKAHAKRFVATMQSQLSVCLLQKHPMDIEQKNMPTLGTRQQNAQSIYFVKCSKTKCKQLNKSGKAHAKHCRNYASIAICLCLLLIPIGCLLQAVSEARSCWLPTNLWT